MIVRPEGNWLIDSPRYLNALVRKFDEMGGAKRIIHINEKSAQPDAEHAIEGLEVVQWDHEITLLVTPGHTRGHMVPLYKNRYLFTGDHLAWIRNAMY